jgi:hypothetical protein
MLAYDVAPFAHENIKRQEMTAAKDGELKHDFKLSKKLLSALSLCLPLRTPRSYGFTVAFSSVPLSKTAAKIILTVNRKDATRAGAL